MKEKTKKIIKETVGWIVYIAFLIGLVYGVPRGLSYYLKTEYPMASITSGSMWPVLKKGDLVLIEGIDSRDELRMGDIVVYKNPKGFTIHRITELRENTLVTKGDANNVSDSPVAYEDVIGKTVDWNGKPFRIPFLGSVGLLINKNNIE